VPWELISDSLYGFAKDVVDVWDSAAARTAAPWYNFHNGKAFDSIKHRDYNAAVRGLLDDFITKRCGGSSSNMNPALAEDFLAIVDNQPATSLIGRFNTGVRLEAQAATSLGNALYNEKLEDFVNKNPGKPVPRDIIRREVLDEIGPLITKGGGNGRLRKVLNRLKLKGHNVGKIALPVAAFLAAKPLLDGSIPINSRSVGRALADCSPLGIPIASGEVLGAIAYAAQEHVAPVVGGGKTWVNASAHDLQNPTGSIGHTFNHGVDRW
jgi:hypothetical protein